MKTKIIQITSGKGPAECCLAVALALKEIIKEIKELRLQYEVIERTPGPLNGTLHSAAIKVEGTDAEILCNQWEGNLLWITKSPYRKFHKRKNWFIGIHVSSAEEMPAWNEKEIQYQTMRASGPGGQNVNKVESAVRATHLPSGIQVMVNENRSQLQNRKTATERLKEEFAKWQIKLLQRMQQSQWQNHNNLERGNPKRIYSGTAFIKQN